MFIDFSEYLGQVKNDTDILGKAFIFKVIAEKFGQSYTFDTILFVHETINAFVSIAEEDSDFDKTIILKLIFDKYTIKQLLEAEHEN